MARPKVGLVVANQKEDNKTDSIVQRYVELIEIIRKTKNQKKIDEAFNEIVSLLKTRLDQISHKFFIPGLTSEDILQESLFALRYKAIKDYDQGKSGSKEISPFDRFAVLCIRRHLSTKLKASYQNQHRVWISAISLDQDRYIQAGESLFLADIIPDKRGSAADDVKNKEYYNSLMSHLDARLSSFEKKVLELYKEKLSYEEIAEIINKGKRKENRIKVKSIDNALSRIKIKGKEVNKKYGGDGE